MAIDVFISVGRTSTPEQEEFVLVIEKYLRDNGLEPRAIGRSDFSSQQPLKFIERLMNQCSGTVIIAFERIHIHEGIEKRGSEAEKSIQNLNLPTVWNQIEASMAYLIGQPLLVIVEQGLYREGLLETGYDWYVQWVNIDASILNNKEFKGVFAEWKSRVEEYKKNSGFKKVTEIDVSNLTISQIISSLKPAHLWAIIGVIVAIIVAAYKIGTLFSNVP